MQRLHCGQHQCTHGMHAGLSTCETVLVAGLGGSLAASLSEEKSRMPASPAPNGNHADLG